MSLRLRCPSRCRRFRLPRHRHVPILRARQALFQIARRRGGVGGIAARHDERRDVEAHQVLRLGADPLTMSQAEFEAMIRREFEENARLIKAADIKAN